MWFTMDTKQIEYILKIAEEGNITHAAEKLFLTQPALNQQLLRLEKELGTRLFVRSRTDWRPTEAGMVYLENARKMLHHWRHGLRPEGTPVHRLHARAWNPYVLCGLPKIPPKVP